MGVWDVSIAINESKTLCALKSFNLIVSPTYLFNNWVRLYLPQSLQVTCYESARQFLRSFDQ